ncbi:MAG: response regulator [Cyclobacteriaceae bacterium]|jgi:CheY-like chemotaxis protein|nr:response regulator [Cyclobacteriaceae bacterium]
MNILIGEDNSVTRQVMEAQVGARGHTVTTASTAAEVVAHHAAIPFDVVLLDFHLDEDAPVVLQRMQAAHTQPWPRIFLLTAESAVRMAPKAEGLPVEAVWTKPLQPDHLDQLNRPATSSGKTEGAIQSLSELLGNNPERLKKIIDIFVRETPKYLHAMKQAVAARHARALQATVHKAKAGYGYLGLTALHHQLDDLEEKLDKPVAWDDVENEVNQLEVATLGVLRQLTQAPKQ